MKLKPAYLDRVSVAEFASLSVGTMESLVLLEADTLQ